jgi:hypothetical protein
MRLRLKRPRLKRLRLNRPRVKRRDSNVRVRPAGSEDELTCSHRKYHIAKNPGNKIFGISMVRKKKGREREKEREGKNFRHKTGT